MKNMKALIIKGVLGFIVILVCLSSCEDFLDVPIEGQLPEGYVQEVSPEEAFQYVSACYAGLRKWGVSVFPYMGIFEITSDDADKGSTDSDGADMIELDNFKISTTNGLISSFWSDNYEVISNCNYAINKINSLKFDDDKVQKQMVSEAKFIRSFLYLHMNLAFGGVPVTDTTRTADDFAKIPRSSKEDVYAFIVKDLTEAIPNLPEAYDQQMIGRATSGAAKALLARTNMYMENWPEVQRLTNEIIGSQIYLLYPNFFRLFRVAGENSTESIFELQLNSMNQAKYRCEYGFVQGPRSNFAQLQGWGFKVPNGTLKSFLLERGDTVRFEATFLPRGSRTPYGDSINSSCPNPYYNYKVYTQKQYNTVDYALDHNIRFIRYAEVLLMNAEAAARIGGDVQTPLNEVRKRVDLDPIVSPTLQDVFDERRAEFAMEEFRFFDLVRTGKAAESLANKGFMAGRNEVFPIPQTQIDLSNGVLIQNPGY